MSPVTNPKAVNSIIDIPILKAQFEQKIMQDAFSKDPLWLGMDANGSNYLVYEKVSRSKSVKRIYQVTDFFRSQ